MKKNTFPVRNFMQKIFVTSEIFNELNISIRVQLFSHEIKQL